MVIIPNNIAISIIYMQKTHLISSKQTAFFISIVMSGCYLPMLKIN